MKVILWTMDTTHRLLGNGFDNTAQLFEEIAEALRWLAYLTRDSR